MRSKASLAVLHDALGLLSEPDRWIKGAYGDAEGRSCLVQALAFGAECSVTNFYSDPLYHQLKHLAEREFGLRTTEGLTRLNDLSELHHVQEFLKRAIELEETPKFADAQRMS